MSRTVIVKRMSSGLAHNVQVRVLVVEDHVALANRIGEGLRDAGFAVDVVYDGAAALESTISTDYDVVVLDRDLPAVHGDRVCRALVRDAWHSVPAQRFGAAMPAFLMSLERLRGVHTYQAPAFVQLGYELRRM